MRIDRMLSIVIILLNRDKITAKELAEKFEVNLRTIYRDIDAINLAGIPIISFPGNKGGFGIMPNYKLDKQLLSLQDMASMLTALKSINSTLENNDIDNAIGKISSLVPDFQKEEFEQNLDRVVIDILPWGFSEKHKKILRSLHEAVMNSQIIEFTYSDMKMNASRRSIEPITLLIKGYSWYLFGFCLERNDFRLFKVLRIKDIVVSEKYFQRRKANYRDFVDYGDKPPADSVNIELKFDNIMLPKLQEFFSDEEINVQNNNIFVTTNVSDDQWVVSWILSFGATVEVLKPEKLRQKIKNIVETINKKYQY